jgi:hypothetical protein
MADAPLRFTSPSTSKIPLVGSTGRAVFRDRIIFCLKVRERHLSLVEPVQRKTRRPLNSKEPMMFEDVKQIRKLRKKYNAQMLLSGISTFRELEELGANVLRDGELA